MVKPPVVGAGEGDHKLARLLSRVVHGHVIGRQHSRAQHGDQLEEKVGLGLKEIWEGSLHDLHKEEGRRGEGPPFRGWLWAGLGYSQLRKRPLLLPALRTKSWPRPCHQKKRMGERSGEGLGVRLAYQCT